MNGGSKFRITIWANEKGVKIMNGQHEKTSSFQTNAGCAEKRFQIKIGD